MTVINNEYVLSLTDAELTRLKVVFWAASAKTGSYARMDSSISAKLCAATPNENVLSLLREAKARVDAASHDVDVIASLRDDVLGLREDLEAARLDIVSAALLVADVQNLVAGHVGDPGVKEEVLSRLNALDNCLTGAEAMCEPDEEGLPDATETAFGNDNGCCTVSDGGQRYPANKAEGPPDFVTGKKRCTWASTLAGQRQCILDQDHEWQHAGEGVPMEASRVFCLKLGPDGENRCALATGHKVPCFPRQLRDIFPPWVVDVRR